MLIIIIRKQHTTTQQQQQHNNNNMSYDRAEFASSKFVNAIGDKKDAQFAGKDLRSFRTSPDNLYGASYDE